MKSASKAGDFSGFGDPTASTRIPDSLFSELLPHLQDLSELKVVLYSLWRIEHMDSGLRAVAREDFAQAHLGLTPAEIDNGLERALEDRVLLKAGSGPSTRYVLNSPEGQATAKALADGRFPDGVAVSSTPLERPSIFSLYEQNIGPLTPLIADALKDAESTFPEEWVSEAIELAVRNNKRSWSYCEAILRRWKEEGRGAKQNRRDDQAARQRDVEEKIRKFIRG
ncbi:MAG TPA: DnaD domain protein [Anaerolineales bacterium]|nr:DnaD domain protein [Anaerolineales bacterium]